MRWHALAFQHCLNLTVNARCVCMLPRTMLRVMLPAGLPVVLVAPAVAEAWLPCQMVQTASSAETRAEPNEPEEAGSTETHTSPLVNRYATKASEAALRRVEQLARNPRDAARRSERIRALESSVRQDALRELVRRGLDASGADRAEQRALAIETLAGLESYDELADACTILGADRPDGGRLATDREACLALASALARDPNGQVILLRLAVARTDLLGDRCREALPRVLSMPAEDALCVMLQSKNDAYVERAAMVASAHTSAGLIPALIQAQTSEQRRTQGDEGWIAFGRTRWYIANAIPVVGNGSTSFLPVPGSVFEGSVLRIQESVVVVYRTEVHRVLVATVEELTGIPAPPFGYDRTRWARWHETEFPQLWASNRAKIEERTIRSEMRTTQPRMDM